MMGGADAHQLPLRRRRRLIMGSVISALLVLGAACTASSDRGSDSRPGSADDAISVAAEPDGVPGAGAARADVDAPETPGLLSPRTTPDPLAVDLGDTAPLPGAPVGFEALVAGAAAGPTPTSLTIEDLDIGEATVISVAVNEDLSLEVPPADEVGWYEFGPSPGEPGSAVLAAHIAFDGVDGVFRNLEDLPVGAIIEIGYDDGSVARFRVTEVVEYLKEDLPDTLFSVDGPPRLALITCGGDFNPGLRSYESNTVAIAVPI